jgi:LysR family hydrogen peroxide-inducible transcriptional activator
MPTLTQLQYAIEVERHRHFGHASRACHVSQPTLSQQLQKLEEEVGIILFDRTKKPILPTPEGQAFLDQAKIVLREHEKLLHVSKQSQDGTISGDFRLAVIPTVSSYLLPLFLKPFSKAHPKVRLFIEEMKTETVLRELAGDHLDGAILATPVEGSDLNVHPLYYEPFYAYLSARHPLLKHAHIAKEDLDVTEMWLLQDGHCFKDQVLNFCALPGDKSATQANVRFQSGSLDTLRRMVQSHQGYTLIPAMMALSLRKDEQAAHVRPFRAPVPTREISLIYRRDHWKLDVIRAIEETVAQSLPDGIHRKPEKSYQVLDVC